ncbi:MAG: hypothetical protein A2W00_04215 [Candidatus Eisenbacteria bacterium RBG_16_71_46]|nr:MAG: hypothetical protein A2W00_04215 [Candidatus Eisenbacteria bacterium RBG_16_71_46]OGF21235.1 MAG: hypothetical protein A2V63_08895 [Candidatus Eisenbacteria bacterium RBG_19FT_COMBO_70_11]
MTPLAAGAGLPGLLPGGEKLLSGGVRVVIALALAFLLQRLVYLLVARMERWLLRAGQGSPQVESRAHTLGQIFRSLTTAVIALGTLVYVLIVFGWDVRPLLAGAGIAGVAFGFGAQTMVRDVIAGVFILSENQFSVGDVIEVNGKAATVESITVRRTSLRDFNGYVYFVPNGELRIVVNRSRGWTCLALDVPVALGQDLDRALDVCRKVAAQMNGEPEWQERLLDPIALWGIESFGPQEAQIRMVVRTRPGADAPETVRELRRRVHRALAVAGLRAGDRAGVVPVAAAPLESRGSGS